MGGRARSHTHCHHSRFNDHITQDDSVFHCPGNFTGEKTTQELSGPENRATGNLHARHKLTMGNELARRILTEADNIATGENIPTTKE
jgi:hypothetical protein